MSEISIARPAAGETVQILCAKGDVFRMALEPEDAVLTREGATLYLVFPDGARVELTDFYTSFEDDSVPAFIVGDVQVTPADFFTALGAEDIMPAAGPSSSDLFSKVYRPEGGGRFNLWNEDNDAVLMEGLGSLDVPDAVPAPDPADGLSDGYAPVSFAYDAASVFEAYAAPEDVFAESAQIQPQYQGQPASVAYAAAAGENSDAVSDQDALVSQILSEVSRYLEQKGGSVQLDIVIEPEGMVETGAAIPDSEVDVLLSLKEFDLDDLGSLKEQLTANSSLTNMKFLKLETPGDAAQNATDTPMTASSGVEAAGASEVPADTGAQNNTNTDAEQAVLQVMLANG